MTAQTLPRAQGSIVRCNYEACTTYSVTGQVRLRERRIYLRSLGWIRGIVSGTRVEQSHRRWDICPIHAPVERDMDLERKRAAADRRATQDAARLTSVEQRIELRNEKRRAAAERREAAKRRRANRATEVQP